MCFLFFRLALVSCGGGVMTVYRSCTNPAPQGGGANCSGLARMDQACNVNPCPLESGQCGFFKFFVPSWYLNSCIIFLPPPLPPYYLLILSYILSSLFENLRTVVINHKFVRTEEYTSRLFYVLTVFLK